MEIKGKIDGADASVEFEGQRLRLKRGPKSTRSSLSDLESLTIKRNTRSGWVTFGIIIFAFGGLEAYDGGPLWLSASAEVLGLLTVLLGVFRPFYTLEVTHEGERQSLSVSRVDAETLATVIEPAHERHPHLRAGPGLGQMIMSHVKALGASREALIKEYEDEAGYHSIDSEAARYVVARRRMALWVVVWVMVLPLLVTIPLALTALIKLPPSAMMLITTAGLLALVHAFLLGLGLICQGALLPRARRWLEADP